MFTTITRLRPVFIAMTILAVLISLPLDHAYAALVTTESSLNESRSDNARNKISALLARADVKAALLQNGIDPSEAEARIWSLTDDEVTQVWTKLDDLAAAGDMGMSAALIAVMIVIMVAMITFMMFGWHSQHH